MLWTCVPPKIHYVEQLITNITIFGNRAFKELIKIKSCPKCGDLIRLVSS